MESYHYNYVQALNASNGIDNFNNFGGVYNENAFYSATPFEEQQGLETFEATGPSMSESFDTNNVNDISVIGVAQEAAEEFVQSSALKTFAFGNLLPNGIAYANGVNNSSIPMSSGPFIRSDLSNQNTIAGDLQNMDAPDPGALVLQLVPRSTTNNTTATMQGLPSSAILIDSSASLKSTGYDASSDKLNMNGPLDVTSYVPIEGAHNYLTTRSMQRTQTGSTTMQERTFLTDASSVHPMYTSAGPAQSYTANDWTANHQCANEAVQPDVDHTDTTAIRQSNSDDEYRVLTSQSVHSHTSRPSAPVLVSHYNQAGIAHNYLKNGSIPTAGLTNNLMDSSMPYTSRAMNFSNFPPFLASNIGGGSAPLANQPSHHNVIAAHTSFNIDHVSHNMDYTDSVYNTPNSFVQPSSLPNISAGSHYFEGPTRHSHGNGHRHPYENVSRPSSSSEAKSFSLGEMYVRYGLVSEQGMPTANAVSLVSTQTVAQLHSSQNYGRHTIPRSRAYTQEKQHMQRLLEDVMKNAPQLLIQEGESPISPRHERFQLKVVQQPIRGQVGTLHGDNRSSTIPVAPAIVITLQDKYNLRRLNDSDLMVKARLFRFHVDDKWPVPALVQGLLVGRSLKSSIEAELQPGTLSEVFYFADLGVKETGWYWLTFTLIGVDTRIGSQCARLAFTVSKMFEILSPAAYRKRSHIRSSPFTQILQRQGHKLRHRKSKTLKDVDQPGEDVNEKPATASGCASEVNPPCEQQTFGCEMERDGELPIMKYAMRPAMGSIPE